MPSTCPACGGPHIQAVADHYDAKVRLQDADPEALAPFAPPIRRSILPGTACITLFWLAALSPGFVGPARALSVAATFMVLGAVTLYLWLRARKTDRAAMAAYQKRRICQDCGWTQ